jgi:hypothetical protein
MVVDHAALEARIDALVRLAMEDLQRNGVPVINQLLREAREAAPKVCSFDEGCEACQ